MQVTSATTTSPPTSTTTSGTAGGEVWSSDAVRQALQTVSDTSGKLSLNDQLKHTTR